MPAALRESALSILHQVLVAVRRLALQHHLYGKQCLVALRLHVQLLALGSGVRLVERRFSWPLNKSGLPAGGVASSFCPERSVCGLPLEVQ